MSVIIKEITLAGSKGKRRIDALFDSGTTYSCIQPRLAASLGNPEMLPSPMRFGTAKNGNVVVAKFCIRLDFRIRRYRFSDEFMVIDDLSEKVIIGACTLQKWRLKLDFVNDDVIFDPGVTKLRLV